MEGTERRYQYALERARGDANVLGVILFGSRVADVFISPASDFDCFVIVREPDARSWQHVRGSGVETVAATVAEFQRHASVGTPTFWNRPSFLYARVEIDKADGEIDRLLEAKRRLNADEADMVVRETMSAYINSLYRSLKNLRDGRLLAGRFDGLESLPPLLTVAFALEGRVRPFSKWLEYDLERQPLSIPEFLRRVTELSNGPRPAAQRAMFRDVEALARSHGYDELIDDWYPDVPFLRGEASHLPAPPSGR